MVDKNAPEFEGGYNLGFYNALSGVAYMASTEDTSVERILIAVNDMMEEMRNLGEVTEEDTAPTEGLIALVQAADATGDTDALFAALDEIFGMETK